MLVNTGYVCPIYAQRNKCLRMGQLHLSRSGLQHDERSSSRVEQEKMRGLKSFQEHRECGEKNESTRLRVHFSDSTIPRALAYTSETWSLSKHLLKQEEWLLRVIEYVIERTMQGVKPETDYPLTSALISNSPFFFNEQTNQTRGLYYIK